LNLSGGNKTPPSADKRAPLKPGVVSPPLAVPDHIPRPSYAATGQMPPWDNEPQIHKGEGLRKMRAACKLAAEVLNYAGTLVKPGVTTDEIDRAVHAMIIENGAYPSPLNYGNFPKSVCTSVNECICHGIPDSRPLKEGDILNIDVTVYLQASSSFFLSLNYCEVSTVSCVAVCYYRSDILLHSPLSLQQ
jgi:methionyl aminopeptidase